jgi:hypothetical protein
LRVGALMMWGQTRALVSLHVIAHPDWAAHVSGNDIKSKFEKLSDKVGGHADSPSHYPRAWRRTHPTGTHTRTTQTIVVQAPRHGLTVCLCSPSCPCCGGVCSSPSSACWRRRGTPRSRMRGPRPGRRSCRQVDTASLFLQHTHMSATAARLSTGSWLPS